MQWPHRPEVRSSDPEHPPAHSLIALQPIPLAVTRAHTPSSLTLQPYSSTCSTQTHCSWRHRGAARTRGKRLPQSAHSSLAHACTGNSLGDSTRQSLSCCAVRFTAHLAWQLRLLQQPPQPRSPICSLPPARTLSHLFFLCRWIYFILYRDTLHALLRHSLISLLMAGCYAACGPTLEQGGRPEATPSRVVSLHQEEAARGRRIRRRARRRSRRRGALAATALALREVMLQCARRGGQ